MGVYIVLNLNIDSALWEHPVKLMTAIYAFTLYGLHSLCSAGV